MIDPPPCGHHPLPDQRRQPERTLQVEVDDRIEQLLGHRAKRLVQRRHARVVDEHVDLAEAVVCRVDQPVELIPAPDVHLVRQRSAARRGGDLLRGGHARVVLAARDDDVGTAVRGGEGHLPAKPPAATGDQHHPVGEVEEFVRVTHALMVSRCSCYSSGTRCRSAASQGRAPIPSCPRTASSRPRGCPMRSRASR